MNTPDKGLSPVGEGEKQTLLFFNYHEYQVRRYRGLDCDDEDFHSQSLIITHFPNPHTTRDSVIFQNTRIVRIPRVFNNRGCQFPEFSTLLPGNEDAAILDDGEMGSFKIKGEYSGDFFGTASASPLGMYLTDAEFNQITSSVNQLLKQAHTSFSFWNVMEFLIDLLTFWTLYELFTTKSKNELSALEDYIDGMNLSLSNRGVKIISPRRSAYLSLDFQIPRPTLGSLTKPSLSSSIDTIPLPKEEQSVP